MGWDTDVAAAEVRTRFARFAEAFPDLELYERLASGCAGDAEVAGLLGVARAGQARPVLLFAAVHDLVLRNPGLDLGRWYSSVTPIADLAGGDPWPTFRQTCLDHRDELERVIATRTTQTNEVNRVAILAVGVAAACADLPGEPVTLVELGASAGLLLGLEHYRIEVGDEIIGATDSKVRVRAEMCGGGRADLSTFPDGVTDRLGIDLDPVSLFDGDRVRWLEACLWPDQPWRIERFRAAVVQMRPVPPRVVIGDFVDLLPDAIEELSSDGHLVIVDSWALTYVARPARDTLVDRIGAAAMSRRSVSWVSAEPPGCVPGIVPPPWAGGDESTTPDTVLGLRRWRSGHEIEPRTLGWAHPHGNWLALSA